MSAGGSSAGSLVVSFVFFVVFVFVLMRDISGRASSSPRADGPRRRVALPLHPREQGPGSRPPAKSARAWSAERRNHFVLPPPPSSGLGGARSQRQSASPSGAPRAAFLSPGPCFRARTGPEPGPRSGQLSPPFVRAASSHSRQALVVGPDGDPGPPGGEVTSLASGRRPSPACRHVCRQAPRVGEVMRTIKLGLKRSQAPTLKHGLELQWLWKI